MTNTELSEQTKDEWRELGFFYNYDEGKSCWQLIGSRPGLLNFCDILNEYADDKRDAPLSDHEHYGPYWYLTFITWKKPQITSYGVFGTLEDCRS